MNLIRIGSVDGLNEFEKVKWWATAWLRRLRVLS